MCNRYVGEWIDGTRQGKGTFYYARLVQKYNLYLQH